nr:MAG TPA: hypothetical protein [Caudoviricetes sp.]
MTKIVEILEIVILLTCAVYVAFRVAKAITQKKPQEPEKETLCDTCEYLVRKGGDIESGKYKCGFEPVGFCKSPEYCRNYEQREEKKEPTEVNADD